VRGGGEEFALRDSLMLRLGYDRRVLVDTSAL
jgi:hypothetical protein